MAPAGPLLKRLMAAISVARIVCYEWDLKTDRVTRTPNALEVFGPLGGTATSFLSLIHPDDIERAQLHREAILQGCPYPIEFRMLLRDGRMIWVMDQAEVTHNALGEPTTVTGVCMDITERKLAEEAWQASENRLALAIETAELATWDNDLKNGKVDWSRNHYKFLGYPLGYPNETQSPSREKWLACLHPEDRDRVLSEVADARQTGERCRTEYRIQRADNGESRWLQATGQFLYDELGRPERFLGVFMDITERKDAEAHLQLLINELNHRVKNTLANVQSIAFHTARSTDTKEAFLAAFTARLTALSRAQNLLTRQNWRGACLKDIVEEVLLPYRTRQSPDPVQLEGSPLGLTPKVCLALSLALHELATNASKYGSLSVPTGRLRVSWWQPTPQDLILQWQESHGPPVTPPTRHGFGTRLLQQGLRHELGGDIHLHYHPHGFHCQFRIPLINVAGAVVDDA